jgi:hypothetical protein
MGASPRLEMGETGGTVDSGRAVLEVGGGADGRARSGSE